jgi:two-component system sensor histidine kinase PilS (NtrC family)
MAREKSYLEILNYHALGSLLLLFSAAAFSDRLVALEELHSFNRVFLLFVFVGLGHLLLAFTKKLTEASLIGIFLADLPIVLLLVKSTGASTSPFLVLYPILSLMGSIGFSRRYAILHLLAVLSFQTFSVGFGPAMVGNGLATITTSILGMYLATALQTTDEKLSVSEGQRLRLENLQRAILANIPSGLMSVDSQGRIIQINAVGVRILGFSEAEILMNPLKQLLPQLDEQVYKLNTLIPAINKLQSDRDRTTIRYRTPKGEFLQLGFSVARLLDPQDNSILGSLVVFQDLTEIIRLEESLRTTEKLAAVGKLAAGIAHEIRNPLAGISGSAQMLSSLTNLGEEDQKLLAIIQRESNRLDGLITEFLEYVRPARAKMEVIDLNQIAHNVVESLKVSSKWKGLKTTVEIKNLAPDKPEVRVSGDANKVTQVLINLILNSGQAGASEVQLLLNPSQSCLEVRDNGSGISAEHQKRLFEPFFTTKEGGTGLGLATCYRVMESMSGRIEVFSPLSDFDNLDKELALKKSETSVSSGTSFRLFFSEVAALKETAS